jgi:hypothetical protein
VRRLLLGLILASSALFLQPPSTTHGQITTYECQQLFRQMAGPYMQQVMWYANQQNMYQAAPWGRPYLSPGPIAAYPGFAGIVGPGGPGWGLANTAGPVGLVQNTQTLALTGGGLSVPAVTQAFVNATPGGFSNLGTANLATLAPLQQSLQGNILAAAALRESVIANRLSAATLWTTLSGYPWEQADNLGSVVGTIATWVHNTCPAATPGSNGSPPASGASGSQ